MPEMTITEALAEIKTIQARIAKKKEAVMRYFSRDSRLRDPMEGEGGSKEFVRRERQGITDLEERVVKVRCVIQHTNLHTSLTVCGRTRSLQEWLNWRREVSAQRKAFLTQMTQTIAQVRQNAVRQGMAVTDRESSTPGDVIVTVNEQELAREVEELEDVLGSLDGKLSLLNATTFVTV